MMRGQMAAGPSASIAAAGQGRRGRLWPGTRAGINALHQANAAALRDRSHEAALNNPYAGHALDVVTSNLVGTGIKPQPMVDDPAVKAAMQRAWADWTDEADAAGLTDFYGLQALITRTMVESGECFVRFRPRPYDDGLTVPLRLQVLEPEFLDTTRDAITLSGGGYVRGGIEFDQHSQRVAYHFHRWHPNDGMAMSPLGSTRVPAEDVMHVFRPLRPGQERGLPWFTQVLVKLYELDQYDDAELVRKKVAAMFTGFITRAGVVAEDQDPNLPPADPIWNARLADDPTAEAELQPGTMQVLTPGDELKIAEPADVGGSYAAFMQQQLRSVAIGIGITYEQLTGDLTGVNFSSIRAGLLEMRRLFEQLQHSVLVFQFCRPVWRRWVVTAALAGRVSLPGYAIDPARYTRVKWVPQGWSWVDPVKEIAAVVAAIRAGLMSRSDAISQYGYDAEEIDAQLAADKARADRLGLVLDSDPAHTSQAGLQQSDLTKMSRDEERPREGW
ncbi:MAG: phage portal protein [Alphaproteobacteria bacterium]|nr:phage portal protein [Alphaproteobacteria bacterium]